MRFKETIPFTGNDSALWELLNSGSKISGWCTVFPVFEGEFSEGSTLTLDVAHYGIPVKKCRGKITAYIQDKYLSFSYTEGPGSWWYEVEHIFRFNNNKKGQRELVCEIYANGFRLRWGKLKFKSLFRKTLEKIHLCLKSELEKIPGASYAQK